MFLPFLETLKMSLQPTSPQTSSLQTPPSASPLASASEKNVLAARHLSSRVSAHTPATRAMGLPLASPPLPPSASSPSGVGAHPNIHPFGDQPQAYTPTLLPSALALARPRPHILPLPGIYSHLASLSNAGTFFSRLQGHHYSAAYSCYPAGVHPGSPVTPFAYIAYLVGDRHAGFTELPVYGFPPLSPSPLALNTSWLRSRENLYMAARYPHLPSAASGSYPVGVYPRSLQPPFPYLASVAAVTNAAFPGLPVNGSPTPPS